MADLKRNNPWQNHHFDKKTEDKSKQQQERENDLSFENGGVVINNTNECEGCQ